MSRICKLSLSVLPILLALVLLGGCQQSGTSRASMWKEQVKASTNGGYLARNFRGRSPAHQPADLEIAMARSLERQGQTERAIKVYLNAVDEGYQGADAYHRLAVLHDKKGDCAASEEFYRKSLKIDPGNAEAHCDQGYSCYLQQRWSEAEASLRRAVALQPDLARAHNNLGLVLGRVGGEDEALLEFVRAGGTEAEARTNLAFAMTMGERLEEAREQIELALAADPECDQARVAFHTLQLVRPDTGADGWAVAVDRHEEEVVHASYDTSPRKANTYR